jgi:ABC-type transport system involved in cytochrome c biogenesis permease subunit
MRRLIPFILGLLVISATYFKYSKHNYVAYSNFRKLPVQEGGRIKPIATLARSTLMHLSESSSVKNENNQALDALSWFLDLSFRPELAHSYYVFKIDHSEVVDFLGIPNQGKKHFSFNELSPHFHKIAEARRKFDAQPENEFSPFQKQLVKLYDKLVLYQSSLTIFHPSTQTADLNVHYTQWLGLIEPGVQAVQDQLQGRAFDEKVLRLFLVVSDRYLETAKHTQARAIVPELADEKAVWMNAGDAVLEAIGTKATHPLLLQYASLSQTFRNNDSTTFNQVCDQLLSSFKAAPWYTKVKVECALNYIQPFYLCSALYLITFICFCWSWLINSKVLYRSSMTLMLIVLLIHTLGIVCRIYIQGRPPVTNLYASAVFIGWAGAVMSSVIERFYKNGLAASVGSLIGFTTLVIAYYLGVTSDTLESVRAVLDSNFWLSTHVVSVTLGYSAMFLAGYFGIAYTISNVSGRASSAGAQMAYATLCFATLFSFIGTLLGGIWADQSWGRFWGWDPKENGALLIVLWCAICLHARWGKLVNEAQFMLMAIFGNIVTAWSWFGTNMLGVGLHSYGFMDKAFAALAGFILLNFLFIGVGLLKALVELKSKKYKSKVLVKK